MRVRVADRPGGLSEVATVIAEAGANVTRLEVVSQDGDHVWDDFEIEAESDQVVGSVVRALRAGGFEVVGLPLHWEIRDWALAVVEIMARMIQLEDRVATEGVFLEGLRNLARTTHAVLLTDDLDGSAEAAESRWESLQTLARSVNHTSVSWSGDLEAQIAVRTALDSVEPGSPHRSPRNRIGGAAFLLGSTPRRGVVAAVGGRPPFLRAEVERLRKYTELVGNTLLREAASA